MKRTNPPYAQLTPIQRHVIDTTLDGHKKQHRAPKLVAALKNLVHKESKPCL